MMQVYSEDRLPGVSASFNIKHRYQQGLAIEATAFSAVDAKWLTAHLRQ